MSRLSLQHLLSKLSAVSIGGQEFGERGECLLECLASRGKSRLEFQQLTHLGAQE
jgi:hypothetical protein